MKERSSVGLQEDFILPEQVFHPTVPDSPERNLMLAVLGDALVQARAPTITGYNGRNPDGIRAQHQAEAVAWIMDDDTAWPFSFVNICDRCGIEPDAIRRTLHASDEAPNISRLWGNERHKRIGQKKKRAA